MSLAGDDWSMASPLSSEGGVQETFMCIYMYMNIYIYLYMCNARLSAQPTDLLAASTARSVVDRSSHTNRLLD